MPAKMNSVLSATTPMNGRSRMTGAVAAACRRAPGLAAARLGDEGREHAEVDEERRSVERGRGRRTCAGREVVAMSPPTRAPSPMPRFITTRCIANAAWRRVSNGQHRDQRRLSGPEHAVADPGHGRDGEALPGAVDEHVARVADREEDEGGGEDALAADAIDERAGHRPGADADERVRREDEPCGAEPDALHVVQVDEDERQRSTPFPNAFARPPSWSSCTARGRRGSRLRSQRRITTA